MHRLVAARRPTSAAREKGCVIASADDHAARRGLLLEVTLHTQIGIARDEQFLIH